MRLTRSTALGALSMALALGASGPALGAITPNFGPGVDPSKFRVTTFATGLNFPTSMQRLSDGSLLVGTSDPNGANGSLYNSTGTLLRLVDANNDGVADGPGTVAFTGLPGTVTSVRQSGNLIFVTSNAAGAEQISVLRGGGTPSSPLSLVGSLRLRFPAGWEHTTFALAVRPTPGGAGGTDLFFNVGSSENATPSVGTVPISGLVSGTLNPDSIYKVTIQDSGGTPTASNLTQVATGLRNASGIIVDPRNGDLLFEDNGIDGLVNANEPLSADELNRIQASAIGTTVHNFGFPNEYITYRTGVHVGSGGEQPLVAFQPLGNPQTGSESEGANEIAFTPAGFQAAGMNPGVFVGFHGKFNQGGIVNEENPVVFYDLTTGQYFHFISNNEAGVGHLDGLLATEDSLFLADISSTGQLFTARDAGNGVIYQIKALEVEAVPEPSTLTLLGCGAVALAAYRRRASTRRG